MKSRFYLLIVFDVVGMRWRPVVRTQTREFAEGMFLTLSAYAGAFFDLWTVDSVAIDDVEAVEAFCAELKPVGLSKVFSAYADVADHAFTLGGGRFVRALPRETTFH